MIFPRWLWLAAAPRFRKAPFMGQFSQERHKRGGLGRRAFLGGMGALASAGAAQAATAGRLRFGRSNGSAPNPYQGVDPATLATRTAIIAGFDNIWPGYAGQSIDPLQDYVVTTSAALSGLFQSGGMSTNPSSRTNWARVQLDSTRPQSDWNASVSVRGQSNVTWSWDPGEWFDSPKDRATYGGGILFESTNPASPVNLAGGTTFNGIRGMHVRNVTFSNLAATPDNAGRDGAQCCSMQSNTSFRDMTVMIFENCRFGTGYHPSAPSELYSCVGVRTSSGLQEQIDFINCQWNGCQTGISMDSVRYSRRFGNDFQKLIGDARIHTIRLEMVLGNSAWDQQCWAWDRLNTCRNIIDNEAIAYEHTDALQFGTSGDFPSSNYNTVVEFECSYMNRLHRTDVQRVLFTTNRTDGQTITVAGTVFTFRTVPLLPTDIQIGATYITTRNNMVTFFTAYGPTNVSPDLVIVVAFSTAGIDFHFQAHDLQPITLSGTGFTQSQICNSGATQAQSYNDDSDDGTSILQVVICSIGASTASMGGLWNGDQTYDRVTMLRPGELPLNATNPPDGFNYSNDVDPFLGRGRDDVTDVVNHLVRSCVLPEMYDRIAGAFRPTDGSWATTNSLLTMTNNRFARWSLTSAVPLAPTVLVGGPGGFGTDIQGRTTYVMQGDGLNSQADFRAQLYGVGKLISTIDRAAIGTTDPATWPSI
jgi:hypothetical protein